MYLLSIICVILLTGVMCVISFGLDLSYVARLVDFPTICLLLLFLVPLLISGGLLKDFKIMLSLSVFVCAVQGIGVIYNMNDPWLLGPYFSMSLLSLVYGMGIALILLPLQARLNIKIQEFISEKE